MRGQLSIVGEGEKKILGNRILTKVDCHTQPQMEAQLESTHVACLAPILQAQSVLINKNFRIVAQSEVYQECVFGRVPPPPHLKRSHVKVLPDPGPFLPGPGREPQAVLVAAPEAKVEAATAEFWNTLVNIPSPCPPPSLLRYVNSSQMLLPLLK